VKPVLVLCVCLAGCGSTAGGLVAFSASATGPADAVAGAPYEIQNAMGYHVVLTRARLHVGAVYLKKDPPLSGAQDTACIVPGINYVAEVFTSQNKANTDYYFDLLSPEKQAFSAIGEGVIPTDPNGSPVAAQAGEVWLNSGDINATDDRTTIFDVAGTADKDNVFFPFEAVVTIGSNRALPVQNPALPGAKPICKQRIVDQIEANVLPSNNGSLTLQIDPRAIFAGVDFATAQKVSDSPLKYTFADTREGSNSLFDGIRNKNAYTFTWTNP
jgi:hypothetical protein